MKTRRAGPGGASFMSSLARLISDLDFSARLFITQINTRLFYIKENNSWYASPSARFDVIPREGKYSLNDLRLKSGSFIEDGCVINTWHGGVSIGERTMLGINTIVIGPVDIGNDCGIAQHCLITGQNHSYGDVNRTIDKQGFSTRRVEICDSAWIGANCCILPGVRIGRHSVIGAGSVVTKSVPDYCVAAGNPAKVIKRYDPRKKAWIRTK